MPWSEITPMHQKTQFIADFLRGIATISELCSRYGISRKTGYKWIDRSTHQIQQIVLPMYLDDSVTYVPDRSLASRFGRPDQIATRFSNVLAA